jgi:carboxypeptidase Q
MLCGRISTMRPVGIVLTVALTATIAGQSSNDAPNLAMYARIRDEGMSRSHVMEYASALMDGIGPRLTASPGLEKAVAWTMAQMSAAGASNVRKESWGEFGMGWRQRNVWVRMTDPYAANVIAVAGPWSPATSGPIAAEVVHVRGFADDSGFAPLRGTLRGKIVIFGRAPSAPRAFPIDQPLSQRLDDAALAELARPDVSRPDDPRALEEAFASAEFGERISRFFADEGVRAVMVPSGNNERGGFSGGTIYADFNSNLGLYAYQKAHAMRVPLVVVAVEEYLRLERLLERKTPVRVELSVDTEFTGDRVEAFNVLADIPGADPLRKDEVVMLTAHLDSWAAATGATDDGAGVVIAIEALRILNALHVQPARTIRVALWTGEEQGLLGSTAYVGRHIAVVPRAATPAQLRIPEAMRQRTGAVVPKPDHAKLSAVYNVDLGGGRIRGVGVAGNAALMPIFERWIAPLRDLGVALVTMRALCAGDCRPFTEAGIPSPGVIQDPLEYDTRTHHTNADTYERLVPDDLRQAAVVMATLVYDTAMRDQMMPRLTVASVQDSLHFRPERIRDQRVPFVVRMKTVAGEKGVIEGNR